MRRAAPRVFAASAAVVVTAALAMGLAVTGTPGKARKLRFDQMRVTDLRALSASIDAYAKAHGKPPPTLSGTDGARPGTREHDPQSGAPYEYIVKGEGAYTLCATFALASTDPEDLPPQAMVVNLSLAGGAADPSERGRWDHPAGRQCFDFTIAGKPGPLAPPEP